MSDTQVEAEPWANRIVELLDHVDVDSPALSER